MNIRTSAFRGLAILSLSVFGLAACEDKIELPTPTPDPIEVTVAPTQVEIPVGGTASAAAVVKNSTNQAVTWSSRATGVATVSPTGTITGVAPGNTIIEAAAAADANAKGFVSVTVVAPTITLTVLPTAATLEVAQTITLAATVSGSANQAVTWATSAAGVATVSAAGVVTAVAPGTAVITATSAANTNIKNAAVITVITAGSSVQITLQPATATTTIGGTVQLVANVTGATNTDVTYESSATGVATVSATGLVTGVSGGTAVITATSVAAPTRKATSVITVSGAPPEPSISIASIVYNPSGVPVMADSIAGQVDVTVNVSAVPENDVRAVVLFIDDEEVCRQNFNTPLGTTQGVATINCPVNTAQLNVDGTPVFPNGLHTFYARAFNEGDEELLAEAQFCPVQPVPGQPCVVRFRNVNSVGVVVVPTAPGAADPQGRMWYKAFTVEVTPSIFTLDPSQQTPTVDRPLVVLASAYRWNNGDPIFLNQDTIGTPTAPAPLGKLIFTFDAAELGAIEDSVYVAVSVSTVGSLTLNNIFGNPNVTTPTVPDFSNPALWIRIDNLAPRIPGPVTAFPNGYINNSVSFALTAAQTVDLGVDREDEAGNIVFDIIDAATGTVVDGCTNVTNATCAPESATNAVYVLRITIKDALGNTATYYRGANGTIFSTLAAAIAGGGTFGVDRTPPVLTVTPSTGDASGETNILPATLTFTWVDTAAVPAGPSGFAANPVRVSVRMYNAQYPDGTCVAVTVTAGAGEVTSTPSTTCNYQMQSPLTLPATLTEAYYVVTADLADAASNRTAAYTWTTLWDMTAPEVGNLVFPSTVVGGQPFTMSAQIADNVELGEVWSTVIYTLPNAAIGGPFYALVLQEDVIGTYGVPLAPAEISKNHEVTVANFIRSITVVDATTGRPLLGYANTFTPLAAEFAVLDVAGNELGDLCPAISTTEVDCPTCAASASTQNCFARRQNIAAAYQIGNPAVDDSTTAWWRYAGFNFVGDSTTNIVTRFQMDGTTNAIDAIATGPAQTFNNPFPGGVQFYRVDTTGRAHLLGLGSISVTDNTITQVRTWRWIYAGTYPVGTTSVFALGLNGTTGDALVTATETVVVVDD